MGKMATWWSSLRFGRPLQPADHDYAGMGTAFGLDASMDTVPSSQLPIGSGAADAPPISSSPDRSGPSTR
jgi:hypothetical protein